MDPLERRGSNYEYASLQDMKTDIRLFDLLPGSFDDDIRINLYHTHLLKHIEGSGPRRMPLEELAATLPNEWEVHETLDGRYLFRLTTTGETSWTHPSAEFRREVYQWWPGAQPSYEAISYVWGDLQTLATVYVEHDDDTTEARGELYIPQSLALALRHVRYTDSARTLWADSISINQLDLRERNDHVKRISDIYKYAYRVIAWLGPAADNSRLAISTLRQLAAQVEYITGRQRVSAPGARYPNWHKNADELPFDPNTWQAMLDLISRDWFDRLWIYQEAQLASPKSYMLCGPDHIDWPQFRKVAMCLRDLPLIKSQEFVDRTIHLERLIAPIGTRDFLILLSRAHQRLCKDQRDKIYGILSLATPKLLRHIEPNYDQAVGSVYKDAFVAVAKQTLRFEILSYAIEEPQRRRDMPSWVPDWSYFPRFPLGHLIAYDMATVTGGYSPIDAEFTHTGEGFLDVAGVRSATVKEVKGAPPQGKADVYAAIKQWAPETRNYPTGEDAEDVFALTLMQGRVNERYDYFPVYPGYVLSLKEQKEAIYREIRDEPRLVDDEERMREVVYKSHNRVFFTTESGHFGIGPAAMQANDLIATILGCDELIALRPLEQDIHQVIGPCYVHGFWDGESLLGPVPAPWQLKYIKDKGALDVPRFRNAETGEVSEQDPRLADIPLPEGWKYMSGVERTREDPATVRWFGNEESGQRFNYDPRMTREKLVERGVPVTTFRLG